MTDVLTTEQRRRCMSRIRGKDTDPERRVRSIVHKLGFRFRLHVRDLPGSPDIVLPRLHKVIFVHGCFWHLHRCRYGRVTPATNYDFWKEKREGTRKRDLKTRKLLKIAGWKILVVWECELKDIPKLKTRIQAFLQQT
jgi:DNA mismatch endonuclease (patch repair protein)